MKIFNKAALTRKQRFSRAVLVGCGCALLAIGIILLLGLQFSLYLSLLYMAVGFGIGYAIQYFGKGVQIQFSLLAAGLTIAVMLVCDWVLLGGPVNIISALTEYGLNSLWEIAYRVVAIFLAYRYSRVV